MRKSACKNFLIVFMGLLLGVRGGVPFVPDAAAAKPVSARFPDRQLILDAGHGGEDGGAVSVTGAPESQINLDIVLKLDQLLGLYGISPILLRKEDISLHDASAGTIREKKISDLHNRVSMIERTENAVLISIHQNMFQDASLHGCQVFYRSEGESRDLAEQVQSTVRMCLDTENRRKAVKIPSSVYLMKHITCPAILVECGFLSNPEEEARLRGKGYQIQLSSCIAGAVLQSGKNSSGGTSKTMV